MKISRRPAHTRDQDLLYNIKSHSLKSYVTDSFGWDEEMQRRIHAQHFDPNIIEIIQHNGQDIGYLQKVVTDGNELHIQNLLIHRDFQNMGIGNRIMKEEIEKAGKKGQLIRLQVLKNNLKAMEFYIDLGFKSMETTSSQYVMELQSP